MAITKILPNFLWWSRRNAQSTELSPDTPALCSDINHYNAFLEPITYHHNSRGFRDREWPDTVEQLQQCIWCFGDSQTVGVGNPISHNWVYLLEQALDQRCINISMAGQSNEWMTRKIQNLLTEIIPATIVIHWSYTHRRENSDLILNDLINLAWKEFYNDIKDESWPSDIKFEDFHTLPLRVQKEIKEIYYNIEKNRFNFDYTIDGMYDEDRVLRHVKKATIEDDTQNTIDCIDCVEQLAQQHNVNVIHSFIPRFAPEDQIPVIEKHLAQIGARFVPVFTAIDRGRDMRHYGVKTASYFVSKIIQLVQDR
jgi:hypothetical protein